MNVQTICIWDAETGTRHERFLRPRCGLSWLLIRNDGVLRERNGRRILFTNDLHSNNSRFVCVPFSQDETVVSRYYRQLYIAQNVIPTLSIHGQSPRARSLTRVTPRIPR